MNKGLNTYIVGGIIVVLIAAVIFFATKSPQADVKLLLDIKQKQDSLMYMRSQYDQLRMHDKQMTVTNAFMKHSLDSMYKDTSKNKAFYVEEINRVLHLSADSTVKLLAKNLSESISN